MNEEEVRARIVAEAKSWIGTPYLSNACIKGRRGGADCGMMPVAVYAEVGLIPKEFDPRPYSPQWHVHRSEEKYLEYILLFGEEVPGPPERVPLPGDFALFQVALAFGHGAIVLNWPTVIHAVGGDSVLPMDISKNTIGKRALVNVPTKFFCPKVLMR